MTELNVSLVRAGDKWQVVLRKDTGEWTISDQVFDTKAEAEQAVRWWVDKIGGTMHRAN